MGGLITVRDNLVLAWDPVRGTEQLLRTETVAGDQIIGAERYQGGLVLAGCRAS